VLLVQLVLRVMLVPPGQLDPRVMLDRRVNKGSKDRLVQQEQLGQLVHLVLTV
jgi:hypothetical protein